MNMTTRTTVEQNETRQSEVEYWPLNLELQNAENNLNDTDRYNVLNSSGALEAAAPCEMSRDAWLNAPQQQQPQSQRELEQKV